MRGRIVSLLCLVLLAGLLGGCSKCGFAWFGAPAACHSDAPK